MINARAESTKCRLKRLAKLGRLAVAVLRCAATFGLAVILFISNASLARDSDGQQPPFSMVPRNIQFTHLSQADGLSQSAINAIAQDQTGYIWIGTQEGLNRYDGYEFSVYEHVASDPNSLSNNWVWDILVDRSGVIWVGTDGGGLDRYDPATDSFKHFRHDPNDVNSLSSDLVRVILQDRSGTIWVGTDGGGLNRLDATHSRFSRFQHDPADLGSLPSNQVLSLHEDQAGHLWVGTDGGGIAILDPLTETFRFLRHDPAAPDSLSNDRVRSIYQDRQQNMWIGTNEGGLNRFDPATQTLRRFRHNQHDSNSISDDRIRVVFEDRQGALWIATDSGLNEWRPDADRFVAYHHDAAKPGSLANDRVTALMQDNGGVLWVGTYNGISKWNYASDAFHYLTNDPALPGSLSGKVITAMAESPNGDLWVGTYGQGLNRINARTGQVSVFHHNEDDPQTLSGDKIMAIWVDRTGMVWLGTRSHGLNKLDPRTGLVQRFMHDPTDSRSLSANGVTSLLGNPDGSLWVGTYGGGLNYLEPDTYRFQHYRQKPGDNSSLSSDRILVIFRDSLGALWVGTEDGGLNRFHENTGSFTSYRHDRADIASLSSDSAWEITETRDGALWIGTKGGGLSRWDLAERRAGRPHFTRYTKADGLASDTIHGILEAIDGALWVSGNRGLTRFDPNYHKHQYFDQWNGLQGSEFNHGARLLARNGLMYFGGTEGLIFFDPASVRPNQHTPTVVVTARNQVETLGSNDSDAPRLSLIELDYRNNFVSFDFAALDYASPNKNQYRYQLKGFDQDWIDPGSHRRATYSNLPPGHYFFQVKGSNNDGVWSEQPARLPVRVVPPPWKTPQAYALYGLLVLGIIGSFFYMERRQLRLETQQRIRMEHEVALRTREIAERNTELEIAISELETASITDALTGLRNRRFLYDYIEKEIDEIEVLNANIEANRQNPVVVNRSPSLFFLMIDLDGFKRINDEHGHHGGDMALLQVCDILRSCCRKSQQIIRWGGDEFLIVGHQNSSLAVEKLAELIRQRLSHHQYQIGGGHVGRLSGSIGFAMYPFIAGHLHALTWEQVIGIADHASYIAKTTQRNAWVAVYSTLKTVPDEEFAARLKSDLERQVALGQIRIATSIRGELLLQDRRKKEQISK